MSDTSVSTIERIRELNDHFRRTFVGGGVVITEGVEAMPAEQRRSLLAKVRAFDAFTEDNDPHGEHDFGAIDEGGVRYFWKVDLYETAEVKRYFIAESFLAEKVRYRSFVQRQRRSTPCLALMTAKMASARRGSGCEALAKPARALRAPLTLASSSRRQSAAWVNGA